MFWCLGEKGWICMSSPLPQGFAVSREKSIYTHLQQLDEVQGLVLLEQKRSSSGLCKEAYEMTGYGI